MSYLATPAAPAASSLARAARAAAPVPRPVAAALAGLAGLALLAAVGTVGPRPTPAPAPRSAIDRCVSPAAVETFAVWPAVAATTTDDEVRGERRPDALAVPAEFRAFQACRERPGG
jgi:hypothetical protein